MEISSAYNSGMQGLQKATESLARNADTVAKSIGDTDMNEEVTTALLESKQNVVQAEASAEVVKAADEVMGTIIDTVA